MTTVLAGCGDLGTEVGLRLVERGRRVHGLRRNAAVLPATFGSASVDLASGDFELPEDTEAVVIATTPDERTPEGYRRGYVDTLAGVLDAVGRLPGAPRRILWVSSTAVYGVDDGSRVDEDSPSLATTGTAGVLAEAERLFRSRVPGGVILRLGGIYGPGRLRLIDRIRETHRIATPWHWVNLIHRDDAAEAIIHLLFATGDLAPEYIGVDGRPALRRDIGRFVAERLGIEATEADSETEQPTGKRLRNERLVATGFTFAYPDYRAGYAALLEDPRARHP